jgi:hypothetical protein
VAEELSAGIPPDEVERRLRELAQLYELGKALREVRLADPKMHDRVRELPDPEGHHHTRGTDPEPHKK